MTRDDVYSLALDTLEKQRKNNLLLQLSTGFGKSKISIQIVNWLCDKRYRNQNTTLLLLVAKRVHKQTWKDEIAKWGGLNVENITVECYESLKKHLGETFTFVVADECHHLQSEARMGMFKTLHFDHFLGLSATIPRKLKNWLDWNFNTAWIHSGIKQSIEDNVLPEPEILLYPLKLDNNIISETIELNKSRKGKVFHGIYAKDVWHCRKSRQHAILRCTKLQKYNEMTSLTEWYKRKAMGGNIVLKNLWLHQAGLRLEFLANAKNEIVKQILNRLRNERTITFCKTISQAKVLGKNCIHSKNSESNNIYNDFNKGVINHITAVNILNENANLVDCKYAVFANISSSDIVIPQRIGRALRHKHPVIIVPFYANTREEEIVNKMFENYNKDYIKTIRSVAEIQ